MSLVMMYDRYDGIDGVVAYFHGRLDVLQQAFIVLVVLALWTDISFLLCFVYVALQSIVATCSSKAAFLRDAEDLMVRKTE